MVFITFPTKTTSEEESLLKKYEKLDRKRNALIEASKPESETESKVAAKPVEVKDAKKVIDLLKQKGALPQIVNNSEKKSEFKRKIPVNHTSSSKKVKITDTKQADEVREAEDVAYDDLFD